MLIIILLLLVGAGAVVYTVMNSSRGSPLAISTRMGRFGLAVPADGSAGGPAGPVIAPTRERQQQSQVSESVERFVGRGKLGQAIFRRLDRAEIKMTPGEFISMWIAILMGCMAVGLLFKGILGLLIMAVVGGIGPWIYLSRRISKRQKKFIEQLADMAQMMGNSMRAGFSIGQSLELVANEGSPPISEEFKRVVTEIKLGLSLEQGLDHMKDRMPSEDIELLVVAISVQRQIGGNLSEILMIISQTIRERVRFSRDLRTLTAQARYSSYIITALPVAVAIVINIMDAPYESFLYKNSIGNAMIGAAVIMLALGFFFLNRIANIEV